MSRRPEITNFVLFYPGDRNSVTYTCHRVFLSQNNRIQFFFIFFLHFLPLFYMALLNLYHVSAE